MNDKPRKPVTLTGRRNTDRDQEISQQPRLTMAELSMRPQREPRQDRHRDRDAQPRDNANRPVGDYGSRAPRQYGSRDRDQGARDQGARERPYVARDAAQREYGNRDVQARGDRDYPPRDRDSQPREYGQRERPAREPPPRTAQDGTQRPRRSHSRPRSETARQERPRTAQAEGSENYVRDEQLDLAVEGAEDGSTQRRSRLFRMHMQGAPRRAAESDISAESSAAAEGMMAGEDGRAARPVNAQRTDETRIYGINACRAVFSTRPDAIVRMYVAQNRLPQFTDMMKYCAANRLAYHVIPEDELINASGSEHHEGICMLIKRRPISTLEEYLAQLPDDAPCSLLVMENVGNPHNLGAVLRSAAHFGVDAVLYNAGAPVQSGSTARVAEGGIEHVKLVEYSDTTNLIEALRANFIQIVATSSHESESLYSYELPKRSAIVFGDETRGISRQLLDSADARLIIPGSGQVESLNVSVAVGVILGELARRRLTA